MGVTVSQSPGEIISLAVSVVPTGSEFWEFGGNEAALPTSVFSCWSDARAMRCVCGKRRKKCSSDGLYLKRCSVLAQIEAATRKRCAPDTARHGGEIVPPSTNSLSIATAMASAGAGRSCAAPAKEDKQQYVNYYDDASYMIVCARRCPHEARAQPTARTKNRGAATSGSTVCQRVSLREEMTALTQTKRRATLFRTCAANAFERTAEPL